MPPEPKTPVKAGASRSRAASHRTEAGQEDEDEDPVTIQAKRSIQSTTSWWKPRAMAGISRRNEPAG